MAYNTNRSDDPKAAYRAAFIRRMNAKLRMKELMHEHDSDRGHGSHRSGQWR